MIGLLELSLQSIRLSVVKMGCVMAMFMIVYGVFKLPAYATSYSDVTAPAAYLVSVTGLEGYTPAAVIAALYLDGGMDAARAFVERYWAGQFEDLSHDMRDAKTRLQEWAQARAGREAPVYTLKERAGPDHAPRFIVEAKVAGFDAVTGEGGSKRQAEQDAAQKLLALVEQ